MVDSKENLNFYRVSHNSDYNKKLFTWASKIVEKPKVIERICPTCHKVNEDWMGTFSMILEGGRKFPEVLGCGAFPLFIVSETVTKVWEEENVTGFSTNPISIADIQSDYLKSQTPPRYFRIIVNGKCIIDFNKSGYSSTKFCKTCGKINVLNPFDLKGYLMVPGSYSDDDLFRDSFQLPAVNFCTEKILEIARDHQFTNFRFEKMNTPYSFSGQGISYKK